MVLTVSTPLSRQKLSCYQLRRKCRCSAWSHRCKDCLRKTHACDIIMRSGYLVASCSICTIQCGGNLAKQQAYSTGCNHAQLTSQSKTVPDNGSVATRYKRVFTRIIAACRAPQLGMPRSLLSITWLHVQLPAVSGIYSSVLVVSYQSKCPYHTYLRHSYHTHQ